MRFATWNVASLKARMPRVTAWLADAQPDVLCLQETKMKDGAFPALDFQALGYDSAHFGQGQWNGVAILSRVGLKDVTTGFGDGADAYPGEARCIAATCGDVRFANLYVPNGREVATDHYERKLVWFEQLATWIDATATPTDALVVLGDFNVAPEDHDVWDINDFAGATHVTAEERAALTRLREWGFTDAFRAIHPTEPCFTFWDFRGGDFHKGRGMRIDLAYVTAPIAERLTFATVDRNARKGEQPSDHAPVIFDLAP
jgi:exodeoxyribonuclease-3